MVNTYLDDNGVFKENIFAQYIFENNQRISYWVIQHSY